MVFRCVCRCIRYTYKYDGMRLFNLLKKRRMYDSRRQMVNIKGRRSICVIVFKDTKTKELQKIETEALVTNGHENCNYVIISNFEK